MCVRCRKYEYEVRIGPGKHERLRWRDCAQKTTSKEETSQTRGREIVCVWSLGEYVDGCEREIMCVSDSFIPFLQKTR